MLCSASTRFPPKFARHFLFCSFPNFRSVSSHFFWRGTQTRPGYLIAIHGARGCRLATNLPVGPLASTRGTPRYRDLILARTRSTVTRVLLLSLAVLPTGYQSILGLSNPCVYPGPCLNPGHGSKLGANPNLSPQYLEADGITRVPGYAHGWTQLACSCNSEAICTHQTPKL
eukprot:3134370-Rhodomonas_salina.1